MAGRGSCISRHAAGGAAHLTVSGRSGPTSSATRVRPCRFALWVALAASNDSGSRLTHDTNRASIVDVSIRSAARFLLAAATFSVAATVALAEPLLPPPSSSGPDKTLADLAAGFQRQQDIFATAENGLSLDVLVNPTDVDLVRSFFAQPDNDFQSVTGRHPFSVVSSFGEWGDEGNFAGVASVGVAARLMVLRRDGATPNELAAARAAAIRAARAWHVYGSIGGPGVVARGIRRIRPENPQDPPLPGGPVPTPLPLKDDAGHPLPAQKGDSWRAPVSTGFDDWIWLDNTSKDQVVGYALAVLWLWDALFGDPKVPSDVVKNLADDLAAFAHALMQVAPETGVDLCIRDADGRLTGFHNLNPRELLPGLIVPADETVQNSLNATLALAIIRAAYHVSGDQAIGRYYYDDLVATRDLPRITGLDPELVFMGEPTNFSNVNMLAIAWATLLRTETNPTVRAELLNSLEHAFWDTGNSRDVSHVKQAWFDAVYAAFAPGADTHVLAERIREDLSEFQPAPAFERDRTNCDDQEIAAGSCVAVDGKTVIHPSKNGNHGGSLVAKELVPMSVRPDSDFEWRSDPFEINGSGSSLMDPRGDYLAAYWFARLFDRDPTRNLSPNARPWPLPKSVDKGGCQCDGGGTMDVVALFALVWARRRRFGSTISGSAP